MFNPFLVAALAALFPLLLGFVWYNPKVFGNAWMKSAGLTEESMKGANMALIFGLTYFFSFLAALSLFSVTIHQMGLGSLLVPQAGMPVDDPQGLGKQVMALYANNYRSFKHGALHGTIMGILLALPLCGINGLFERRGWKYILINAGFWIISLAVMGGIVCQFALLDGK
jgi:hypothetical protein